jgi:hypothetical protein
MELGTNFIGTCSPREGKTLKKKDFPIEFEWVI